jgi:hypothetical protein
MLQVYTGMMTIKFHVPKQAVVNTANTKFNLDICCVDLLIIREERRRSLSPKILIL